MESKLQGLKLSSDFSNIQKAGKRKVLSPWLLAAYKSNDLKTLRFGCTISRKVGSAVIRNKLKRWTKEYFREFFRQAAQNENIPHIDINLVFKARSDEFYKKLSFAEYVKTLEIFFKHYK